MSTSLPILSHGDPIAPVIFWVTLIFAFGLLGRLLAQRCHQPGVLGELCMGVLLGNLCYALKVPAMMIFREGSAVFTMVSALLSGISLPDAVHLSFGHDAHAASILALLQTTSGIDIIKEAYALDVFSRYGVIFLLFMVGLESSVQEMRQTGRESFQVAVIGVLAPLCLGFLFTHYALPEASFHTHLFVGATLTATSVGITARVLKEMHRIHSHEARTILGAAIIDDVLGLMILSVVSSIVLSGHLNGTVLVSTVCLSLFFFGMVLSLGPKLLRVMIHLLRTLSLAESKLFVSFLFVMFLAWLSTLFQLSSIMGAFAAGLIIHDAYFKSAQSASEHRAVIRELMAPLECLLAPLFFMLIGIQVKLESFLDMRVLLIALGLILVALLGKLLSGFGARRGHDRWLVGIGMLPRGEVGLIFASMGRALGVFSDQLFSAIILMVIATTLIAPLWLKARFLHRRES